MDNGSDDGDKLGYRGAVAKLTMPAVYASPAVIDELAHLVAVLKDSRTLPTYPSYDTIRESAIRSGEALVAGLREQEQG